MSATESLFGGNKCKISLEMNEKDKIIANPTPPPKSLLLYLVRMGSFTSTPKIASDDTDEDDVHFDPEMTVSLTTMLQKCKKELDGFPELLIRTFSEVDTCNGSEGEVSFRVFQWNVLSQALGLQNDNFIACPREALEWKTRRFRMLEEILTYTPDILCLQEVDHFNFLQNTLGRIGYLGTFCPKPDSPCIYIQGNNGPDGCAMFYNSSKFALVRFETRILEVWHVQSNQVVILAILRVLETGREICVVTTHLKAKKGPWLSTLRNEQGKDLLEFIKMHQGGRPLILCGDFNAEPSEEVYSTVMNNKNVALASAYTLLDGANVEPPFTTWKIREDGEVRHTIDYMFHSKDDLRVRRLLNFPNEMDIGESRVPSLKYPSDHFSLVVDFSLKSAMEQSAAL